MKDLILSTQMNVTAVDVEKVLEYDRTLDQIRHPTLD